MGEYVELTAPEGGITPRLQPVGRWPWVVLLLGAAIVALGGLLLSPDSGIEPDRTPSVSVTGSAVQ